MLKFCTNPNLRLKIKAQIMTNACFGNVLIKYCSQYMLISDKSYQMITAKVLVDSLIDTYHTGVSDYTNTAMVLSLYVKHTNIININILLNPYITRLDCFDKYSDYGLTLYY